MLVLRSVKEVVKRLIPGSSYLLDQGPTQNNARTKRISLGDAELVATGGKQVNMTGACVHMSTQSFAGARAEIYFGEDSSPGDEAWIPLQRGHSPNPSNGELFKTFRIRLRSDSSVDPLKEIVLIVDQAPYGSVVTNQIPETPEVDSSGLAGFLMKAVRLSDGAAGSLEAADGSTATRARLMVAGIDVGGVGRTFLVGIGAALTGVLRVVQVTTPTGTASQVPVTVATTVVAAANASRREILIRNRDATNPIYVNLGGAAVVATHFLVPAGYSLATTYAGQIQAIATGGTVTADVLEETY